MPSSIPEISALVLAELKADAEAWFGRPVTKAVITVPAYFNDGQRQATKDAGRIAGLEVLRIINEPTSAALAYGFGKQMEKKVVVFDLGGGTFDVSILDIGKSVYDVVAVGGDTYLGGEDFDRRVMDWLTFAFAKENAGDRPAPGQDGAAAAPGRRREGQVRALRRRRARRSTCRSWSRARTGRRRSTSTSSSPARSSRSSPRTWWSAASR